MPGCSIEDYPEREYGLKRGRTFSAVRDGDMIEVGDFHFQCISTPGHSPGHMCLYQRNRKILVAGDHVLSDITPNIAYWLEMDDPQRYLTNLEKSALLMSELFCRGTADWCATSTNEISELQENHRDRLNEVLTALRDGAMTAFQIAPRITWDVTFKSWEEFRPHRNGSPSVRL